MAAEAVKSYSISHAESSKAWKAEEMSARRNSKPMKTINHRACSENINEKNLAAYLRSSAGRIGASRKNMARGAHQSESENRRLYEAYQ